MQMLSEKIQALLKPTVDIWRNDIDAVLHISVKYSGGRPFRYAFDDGLNLDQEKVIRHVVNDVLEGIK